MNAARRIRCLITAGPTREWLDPVRYVSNPSSGKMGYAIAAAAQALGWEVDLVSGPVALPAPEGITLTRVSTTDEMLSAVQSHFPKTDVLIKTAAVCDMRPKHRADHKVKKDAIEWTVEFEPTPDILATIAATKRLDQLVVGFAAETSRIEEHAMSKLAAKNLDYICANDVSGPAGAFESDHNHIVLIGSDGSRQEIGPASKTEVGRLLITRLAEILALKKRAAESS